MCSAADHVRDPGVADLRVRRRRQAPARQNRQARGQTKVGARFSVRVVSAFDHVLSCAYTLTAQVLFLPSMSARPNDVASCH